jgi:hypothetical protein
LIEDCDDIADDFTFLQTGVQPLAIGGDPSRS